MAREPEVRRGPCVGWAPRVQADAKLRLGWGDKQMRASWGDGRGHAGVVRTLLTCRHVCMGRQYERK